MHSHIPSLLAPWNVREISFFVCPVSVSHLGHFGGQDPGIDLLQIFFLKLFSISIFPYSQEFQTEGKKFCKCLLLAVSAGETDAEILLKWRVSHTNYRLLSDFQRSQFMVGLYSGRKL